MTLWETIVAAQTKKQNHVKIVEDGLDIQINISQNGWYEDFVSIS